MITNQVDIEEKPNEKHEEKLNEKQNEKTKEKHEEKPNLTKEEPNKFLQSSTYFPNNLVKLFFSVFIYSGVIKVLYLFINLGQI